MVFIPQGSLKNHLSSDSVDSTSYLITGGQWGIVRVWDVQASRCVLELRGPTNHSSESAAKNHLDFGLHSVSHISLFHTPSLPECDYVLVLSRRSSHVELYNAVTLKLFHEVSHCPLFILLL